MSLTSASAHVLAVEKRVVRLQVVLNKPTDRLDSWVEDSNGGRVTDVYSWRDVAVGGNTLDHPLYHTGRESLRSGVYVVVIIPYTNNNSHGGVRREFAIP